MLAHGGVFTTPLVAQKLLAAVIETPVAVPAEAPEGGAWGMAVLAAYLREGQGKSFPDFLDTEVFAEADVNVCAPEAADVDGFRAFLGRFRSFMPAERAAVQAWKEN